MAQRNSLEHTKAELQADVLLCRRVTAGDPEAQKEFYERYNRLSHYFARIATEEYDTGIVDEEDLAQDAMMYLFNQAPKYGKGGQKMLFSSFASVYMRHNLRRTADDQQYGVRIPQNTRDLIRFLANVDRTLANNNEPVMSDDDISREFDLPLHPDLTKKMSVEEIRQGVALTRHMGSTDPLLRKRESDSESNDSRADISMFESLTAQPSATTEEEVERLTLPDAMDTVLAALTDQEATVIRMRFGLDDDQPKTLDTVAAYYDIRREAAKEIELRAIRKLRQSELIKAMREYLPG